MRQSKFRLKIKDRITQPLTLMTAPCVERSYYVQYKLAWAVQSFVMFQNYNATFSFVWNVNCYTVKCEHNAQRYVIRHIYIYIVDYTSQIALLQIKYSKLLHLIQVTKGCSNPFSERFFMRFVQISITTDFPAIAI